MEDEAISLSSRFVAVVPVSKHFRDPSSRIVLSDEDYDRIAAK